jgi:hypothetical protein
MIETLDPNIQAEELRPGYARYRNKDGRRWEVHGICQHLGYCLVGAILPDGTEIRDVDHLNELRAWEILNPDKLDCPITPEFDGCCSFTYVELDPG